MKKRIVAALTIFIIGTSALIYGGINKWNNNEPQGSIGFAIFFLIWLLLFGYNIAFQRDSK